MSSSPNTQPNTQPGTSQTNTQPNLQTSGVPVQRSNSPQLQQPSSSISQTALSTTSPALDLFKVNVDAQLTALNTIETDINNRLKTQDEGAAISIISVAKILLQKVKDTDGTSTNIKVAIDKAVTEIKRSNDAATKAMEVRIYNKDVDQRKVDLNGNLVTGSGVSIDWDESGTSDGNKKYYEVAGHTKNAALTEVDINIEKDFAEPKLVTCSKSSTGVKNDYSCPKNIKTNEPPVNANGISIITQSVTDKYEKIKNTFSGTVTWAPVPAGTVLVRYFPRKTVEPGEFWTKLEDIRLSLGEIRNGTAVLPHWNTDGAMEMFVVPQGKELEAFSGVTASQLVNVHKCSLKDDCSVHGEEYSSTPPNPVYFRTDNNGTKKYPCAMYEGGTTQYFVDRNELQASDEYMKCIMVVGKTNIPVPHAYKP